MSGSVRFGSVLSASSKQNQVDLERNVSSLTVAPSLPTWTRCPRTPPGSAPVRSGNMSADFHPQPPLLGHLSTRSQQQARAAKRHRQKPELGSFSPGSGGSVRVQLSAAPRRSSEVRKQKKVGFKKQRGRVVYKVEP